MCKLLKVEVNAYAPIRLKKANPTFCLYVHVVKNQKNLTWLLSMHRNRSKIKLKTHRDGLVYSVHVDKLCILRHKFGLKSPNRRRISLVETGPCWKRSGSQTTIVNFPSARRSCFDFRFVGPRGVALIRRLNFQWFDLSWLAWTARYNIHFSPRS